MTNPADSPSQQPPLANTISADEARKRLRRRIWRVLCWTWGVVSVVVGIAVSNYADSFDERMIAFGIVTLVTGFAPFVLTILALLIWVGILRVAVAVLRCVRRFRPADRVAQPRKTSPHASSSVDA